MANLSASKKALRVSKRKTVQNKRTKSRLVRITKKTMKLIELGETKLAQQQLSHAYRALDKAAKKHVIHPNKSARMKASLTKKVNATAKDVKASPKNS